MAEEEIDPCCLLHREHYAQDHEYDCYRAIAWRDYQREKMV